MMTIVKIAHIMHCFSVASVGVSSFIRHNIFIILFLLILYARIDVNRSNNRTMIPKKDLFSCSGNGQRLSNIFVKRMEKNKQNI